MSIVERVGLRDPLSGLERDVCGHKFQLLRRYTVNHKLSSFLDFQFFFHTEKMSFLQPFREIKVGFVRQISFQTETIVCLCGRKER